MRNLKESVIYQIYLRTFTPEGTLKGAERMIPHIKELGVDIIYLSACNKEDDSELGQSPRQMASGMNNPKNPYRISDYFDVDEEFGSMDDLRDFVGEAHKYGIAVLIDLVYLHCGANAVFLKENRDFVLCDKDGNVILGDPWPFARLDYGNNGLREYLYSNMEFYVKDIKADGFRCDASDFVPLDFWEEGARRVKALNPNIIMINEGAKTDYFSVFDINYCAEMTVDIDSLFDGGKISVGEFKTMMERVYSQTPQDKLILSTAESHDTASDLGERRPEICLGNKAFEAMLAFAFAARGIPMIYNGNEVADAITKNMFWNRFCKGNFSVQWQNALLDNGKHRLGFIKKLIKMRHENPVVAYGDFNWIEEAKDILAFTRCLKEKQLAVFINYEKTAKVTAVPEGLQNILLSQNAVIKDGSLYLGEYGILIIESQA